MNQWEINHDSAITCSQIFTSSTHMESASSWLERREDGIKEKEEEEDVVDNTILDEDVNLLITSAVEGAVVYRYMLWLWLLVQLHYPFLLHTHVIYATQMS